MLLDARRLALLSLAVLGLFTDCASGAALWTSTVASPGNGTDLSGFSTVEGGNRLSFGSGLFYDYATKALIALPDRGPGGGELNWLERYHKFNLNGSLNLDTCMLSQMPQLMSTTMLKKGAMPFNGLSPWLLNGDNATLGLSMDAEGVMVGPNGNLYICEEYGPALYEFTPSGQFVAEFAIPDNLKPRGSNGALNFETNSPSYGRQSKRGFEGCAMTPSGKYIYAILQGPLQNDGAPNGAWTRNVRITRFNTENRTSDAQFIYQLDDIVALNATLPPKPDGVDYTTWYFGLQQQGRAVAVNEMVALTDTTFLVSERDDRGYGVEDPTYALTATSKRVQMINVAGATNVAVINLTANALPAGIVPVSKTLYLDLLQSLKANNQYVSEKVEGMTMIQANDGGYCLFITSDNDFSVIQFPGSSVQFDVYTNFNGQSNSANLINQAANLPAAFRHIPVFLWAFKVPAADLTVTPFMDFATPAMAVPTNRLTHITVTLERYGSWLSTSSVTVKVAAQPGYKLHTPACVTATFAAGSRTATITIKVTPRGPPVAGAPVAALELDAASAVGGYVGRRAKKMNITLGATGRRHRF